MDVTMPDGMVIQGVPEGITKSQLMAKYQKFSAPDIKDTSYATDPIRSAYQGTMENVARPINNAVNSVTAPVMGAIASSEAPAAQGIANAIDSTGVGQWVGDKLLGAKDAVGGVIDDVKDLESYNPDLQKDLSAFGQNVQLAGNLPMAISAGQAAGNAGKAIAENRAASIGALPKYEGAVPSEAVKNASQNAYKYSENVGGVLHPDNFTNPILDIIDSAKAKPIAGKVLTSEQRALNSALDEYSPLRDSPLTLDDFQNLDKSLTAKESSAMDRFKPTNNSRIIGQVQDKIRDRLQNLTQGDVIGGKEGFDALTQHAIPLWSTQTKMGDLEAIINRANSMDNPTTAMRTGFRNLANSPRINTYPPEVQDLIRKASNNPSDILGVLGSRLNPIVSDTMTGKAANMVASKAFRGIRNKMQQAKADKILSTMTDPVRDSVARFSTLPESPYPLKPEIPVAPANPYINPKAGVLNDYLPNAEIKPDILVPETNPYFNLGAKTLGKYAPNAEIKAIEEDKVTNPYFNPESTPLPRLSKSEQVTQFLKNLEGKEPELPEPQGTSSTYYSKGGSVKRKNLAAEFLARAS